MSSIIRRLLLAFTLCFMGGIASWADDVTSYTIDGIIYKRNNKYAEVYVGGCEDKKNLTVANIRSSVDGFPVTSIDRHAFDHSPSLKYVSIPSSVTSIGDEAFWCCYSLKTVIIPSSVKSIGVAAFGICPSLSSVTILSNDISIGENAFYRQYEGSGYIVKNRSAILKSSNVVVHTSAFFNNYSGENDYDIICMPNVRVTKAYNDEGSVISGTWYFSYGYNIYDNVNVSKSYKYDITLVNIAEERADIISFIVEKYGYYNTIEAALRTKLDKLLDQTGDFSSLLSKCGTSELATLKADLNSAYEDVRIAIYGIIQNLKPAKEALQDQLNHCHDYDADAKYFKGKKLIDATSNAEAALNGFDVNYINDCTTTLRNVLSAIETEIATNKAKEQEVTKLFEEGAAMRDSISQYLTMINNQNVLFGLYGGTNGTYIFDYYPEFLKLHFAGNVYTGDSKMNSLSEAFNAMYQNFEGNGSAAVKRYDNRKEADRTNLCIYDYADTLSGFISWSKEELERSHEKFSSYCSELHDIIRRVETCLADKDFTHIADSLQTNLRNYYYEINRVNFSSYGYVAYTLYNYKVKDARYKLLSDVETALEDYKNGTEKIAPLQALIDKARLLQTDKYAALYATVTENERNSFNEAITQAQTCVDNVDVSNISIVQATLQQAYNAIYSTMYAALSQQCNDWVAKVEQLKVDYTDVYDQLSGEDALKLSSAVVDVKKADNLENLYQAMQQLIAVYNEVHAKLETLNAQYATEKIAALQTLINKARSLQADKYVEIYAMVDEEDRNSLNEAITQAQTCVDNVDVENVATVHATLQQVYYTIYGTMYVTLNQQCNEWVAKANQLKVDYADVYELLSEEDALKLSNAVTDVKNADNLENLYQAMQQLIAVYNEVSEKLEALRTTTAITNIKEFDSTTRIYDLKGRRVVVKDMRSLKPGVYIINGRKVMIK